MLMLQFKQRQFSPKENFKKLDKPNTELLDGIFLALYICQ